VARFESGKLNSSRPSQSSKVTPPLLENVAIKSFEPTISRLRTWSTARKKTNLTASVSRRWLIGSSLSIATLTGLSLWKLVEDINNPHSYVLKADSGPNSLNVRDTSNLAKASQRPGPQKSTRSSENYSSNELGHEFPGQKTPHLQSDIPGEKQVSHMSRGSCPC
jgi:hypothetical protein